MALAMLGYAAVQSTVMQVAMVAAPVGPPMCDGAMAVAGMSMGGNARASAPRGHAAGSERGHKAACPYCAAAAHAPLVATAAPLRASTALVFTGFRVVAGHGPRGPPAFQPRARGPPAEPLTA